MLEVVLTITSPQGVQQLPLNGEPLTIGRTDAASLVIAGDTGLSKRHATIHHSQDQVRIVDENSTNGTLVNNQPVTHDGTTLANGDEICLGNQTTIKVSIKNSAQAAAPLAQAASASAQAPAVSSTTGGGLPLKLLIPAIAAVLVILCAVGFALYKVTGNSADSSKSSSRAKHDAADDLGLSSNTNGAAINDNTSSADDSSTITTPATLTAPASASVNSPSTSSTADTHILSGSLDTSSTSEAAAPPPGQTKLYQKMSEDEQKEFVKQRAEHIAIMMGKRPYAFTPDALVHIKFWLDAFARRANNHRTGLWGGDTVAILERGCTHAPLIIRAFREYHVPVVVGLYIPFIETEYNNIASNNAAGAAGLFQFLGPTAEGYGVPSSERTNVAKMAPAAARYFRDNIASFGDDSMSVALSIAGYNRAPESVKRDLRNVLNSKNNEDKERSFWTLIANQGKLDEYFQKENINYVPRFFAAAIFGETPWAFGIQMRPLSTYTQLSPEAVAATNNAPPSQP